MPDSVVIGWVAAGPLLIVVSQPPPPGAFGLFG